ncbi:hypothetical protein PIROE2DRAFT_10433 [Piromyces sp. E2]|nr:hypothetical protein PIROE2DRAFT_10433 [Piromyces sp. E2]|eukprot:OUM63121.1 hypothetical protein PIROE2DRAFT_10433 [Piromyces sp. E2]
MLKCSDHSGLTLISSDKKAKDKVPSYNLIKQLIHDMTIHLNNIKYNKCKCGDADTIFYCDGNFIKSSPISSDKCVVMTDCNEFNSGHLFYFNLWTEETIDN